MGPHRIATREEWLAERKALLAKEKALTRARDALAEERRALPWVRVEKDYVFDGPDGPVSLADLFDGRSQLVVYHFMFGPDWEEGCVGCSFLADHVDGARQHFEQNDVSFVAVSRAPFAKIDAFRRRMGWRFRWVSSASSDFNFDFNVSFTPERKVDGKAFYNFELVDDPGIDEFPGTSVFVKDEAGAIFHTYSSYARGGEPQLGAYACGRGRRSTRTPSSCAPGLSALGMPSTHRRSWTTYARDSSAACSSPLTGTRRTWSPSSKPSGRT